MTIAPATSPRELDEFICFPLTLYRHDPLFVPPLLAERRQFFDPNINPLFAFTDVAYFLARDQSRKVIGCVTAHINHRHNEYWKEQTGFFGFFESIESLDVARALMEAAEKWLRERGMQSIRGPFNFSTNAECGFLAQGFDSSPVIMMTYTKRYYLHFMQQLGYAPVKDLLAYEYESTQPDPEFLERLSGHMRAKTNIAIRQMDMRSFETEVAHSFQVYNSAWQRNWGFIPMTEPEFRFTARGLKHIIDPSFGLRAECNGRLVGFALALPDYNQVLIKMRGRLWPFGFINLLFAKRHIDTIRVVTLGVIEEYRGRGIDVLLYGALFRNFRRLGYRKCEMSRILEDNAMMNRALMRIGAVVAKRYQIFEKKL